METRIGGAELAATVHECREWLERGGVDVLQPDVSRCGGLTELRRIAELAELHGAAVVPARLEDGHHRRRRASLPGRDAERPVCRDARPGPLRLAAPRGADPARARVEAGSLPLPDAPGLGVELVPEAVERYRVA